MSYQTIVAMSRPRSWCHANVYNSRSLMALFGAAETLGGSCVFRFMTLDPRGTQPSEDNGHFL